MNVTVDAKPKANGMKEQKSNGKKPEFRQLETLAERPRTLQDLLDENKKGPDPHAEWRRLIGNKTADELAQDRSYWI